MAFIVPVDCPTITAGTIKNIITHHFSAHNNPTKLAITLLKQSDRPEPLIGVFSKDFYNIIYPFIEHEYSRIMAPIRTLPYKTYTATSSDKYVANINTKEDLKTILN